MKPTASIIILTYNNLDYTRQCLESIYQYTDEPDFEVILVDNASQDGTPEYLNSFTQLHTNVQVILNQINTGFAHGNNQGAKIALGNYLVFLNNDVIVTKGWLTGLIGHLQNTAVGMVGPVTNCSGNESRIRTDYQDLEQMQMFAQQYTQANQGRVFEINMLAFFCVAMRREVFLENEGLDERYGIGTFEDDDFARSLKRKGYKILCAEDVFIHHWGNASFSKLSFADYWNIYHENRRLYEEKWGVNWQPQRYRDELMDQLLAQLADNQASLAEYIIEKDAIVVEKDQQIQSQQAQLNEIFQSNAWKLVRIIRRVKKEWHKIRAYPRTILAYAKPIKRIVSLLVRKVIRKLPPVVSPLVVDMESRAVITSTAYVDTRVVLATHRFFDFDGNQVYYGGAERFTMELSKVVRELGYQLEVWQCGNTFWERYYLGLKVIGLNAGGNISVFDDLLKSNRIAAKLIIFSPFSVAHAPVNVPSIGISHGIYWDHESFQETETKLDRTISSLITSLEAVDRIVSVDTTTINWLRTIARRISDKCTYIPNFVDLNQFKPGERTKGNKLVILYPRRLYASRGFHLLAEIMGELLALFPQIEFHLVGQADPPEDKLARQFLERYPGRVKYYQLPADQMHQAYQQADITIIPTLNSEGTSLSCLEALASGNAVIATNVGGLPDLILNGFNGLLIEPNAMLLKQALIQLIEDPSLRQRLAGNGRKVAETFNLKRWQESWRKILINFLPQRSPVPETVSKRALIFNYAYGVLWDGVKQRPHHLAFEFARKDIETYWLNPEGHRPDPVPNLHIMDFRNHVYVRQPIFFIYFPFSYEEIEKYNHPLLVYDVLDDISIHDDPKDENAGEKARFYHKKLIEQADFVIASSRLLYDKIKSLRPDVLFVPNGVDLEHFNPNRIRLASELKRFTHPIVGYHGAIASWFDGQLVADAAKLRPGYDFVLVGPVSDDDVDTILRSQPNIHILGMIPYEKLPPYVAGFDVCILPFVVTPLTNAVRPLKVLEYLAMRKPVVATPIEEIRDWPGVVLASDPQQFAEAIDCAIAHEPIQENSQAVKELLEESTWEKAAKPLIDAILTTSLGD